MPARAALLLLAAVVALTPAAARPPAGEPPASIAKYFRPPAALENDFGDYRSPLLFDDGTPVRTPADWAKRRGEIRAYWHGQMGEWPALIERPKLEYLE